MFKKTAADIEHVINDVLRKDLENLEKELAKNNEELVEFMQVRFVFIEITSFRTELILFLA